MFAFEIDLYRNMLLQRNSKKYNNQKYADLIIFYFKELSQVQMTWTWIEDAYYVPYK